MSFYTDWYIFTTVTKAERTKQFIIEKVAPIFNKKGAYGTSLSDITEATGLTKGAIYGNFKDKDTLAKACFEHNLKFLQKGLYKSLASQGSAWSKLEKLINFYEEGFIVIAQSGGCPLMNSAIESDDGYPLLKTQVKMTFELWKTELAAVILAGQESGEFNGHADATVLAKFFIATIEGGILLSKSLGEQETFKQVLGKLALVLEKELKL